MAPNEVQYNDFWVAISRRVASVYRSSHESMLKVTHLGKFYPPHHGGIETYVQQICGALRDAVRFQVIVANDSGMTVEEEVDGIRVKRLATFGTLARTPLTPGFWWEIRNLKEGIAHLHHPNPIPTLLSISSLSSDVKLIYSYHAEITTQKRLKHVLNPLLRRSLERAAAIIVASPSIVDHSLILQDFREKCHVIPYPIDSHEWKSRISCDRVSELRATAKRPVVLSVGRLVEYKGFGYLIAAMQHVDAELWIIGDGPLRTELERQAGPIREKVKFLGKVNDVANYHEAADIFALASVDSSEAFAIVQLEAMVSGKPVVNTALDSGVPFVSRHGETGFTVQPRNPKALAEAIQALLSDPVLRQEFGERARQRVRKEFDISVVKSETLNLYRSI